MAPVQTDAGEARRATDWVEAKIDRRSMLTNKDRVEDVRDAMWQLEKDGEIVVHRIDDRHEPVVARTLYGWEKRIPTTNLWHHKSCGQCGNIPGYPSSVMWLMNELDVALHRRDRPDFLHGVELPRLRHRQRRQPRRGVPAEFPPGLCVGEGAGARLGTYYPLVHCGTSFGNYKEMRIFLMHSAEAARAGEEDSRQARPPRRRQAADPGGDRALFRMAARYAKPHQERQVIDCSNIRATVHPACHVYKMVPEDVIYDETVMDGNRVAVSTGVMQTLGAEVVDYSTWYDCCGFGFRHIIGEREFTRSFAIDRKIKVAVEEAKADVMIGHDTGCITTLDKNQWIGKAVDKVYALPIMADSQFAALTLGAHPYKLAQLHWHASPFEGLLEKLGIDWQKAKLEFEGYLKEVAAGKIETLYDPKRAITSGPGYVKPAAIAAQPGAAE